MTKILTINRVKTGIPVRRKWPYEDKSIQHLKSDGTIHEHEFNKSLRSIIHKMT